MKLTGPACTEALNEAEEAGRRERAEDSAGGVRVERGVRRRDLHGGTTDHQHTDAGHANLEANRLPCNGWITFKRSAIATIIMSSLESVVPQEKAQSSSSEKWVTLRIGSRV